MKISRVGNYQNLRNTFFEFRKLVHEKKINYRTIKPKDIIKIKNLVPKSYWNYSEADFIYGILNEFKAHLTFYSVYITTNLKPEVNYQTRTVKTSKPKRLESLTYQENKFHLYITPTDVKLKSVKKIKGGKYNPEKRSWIFGVDNIEELVEYCRKYNITIGFTASKIVSNYRGNYENSYSHERVEVNIPLRDGIRLYDYQTVGVSTGIKLVRPFITDQMGLGKTIQAIGVAIGIGEYPILVFCPKSLRSNWKLEIEKFTHRSAIVASKSNIKKLDSLVENGLADFVIMNYDGAKTYFCDELIKKPDKNGRIRTTVKLNGLESKFRGTIIDESHECKNDKSDRYKIIKKTIKNCRMRVLLTGTPFVNHVKDIANQLDLLGAIDDFGGKYQFNKEYAGATEEDLNGNSNGKMKELNVKLRSTCMIRREKWQVLQDLPDKLRRVVKVELTNQKKYDIAEQNLNEYLQKFQGGRSITIGDRANILVQMQILKQVSAEGKVEQVSSEVKEILNNKEKVIIFVWHLQTIEYYRKHFPHLIEISGNVTDKQIDQNKILFQEDEDHNIILITYKKGGVGHTLTAANHVFLPELGWNTKDTDQAEDRAHRIGQEKQVTAHYHIGQGTIDEHIYGIIQRKRELSEDALGSEEVISTTNESLGSEESQLINKLIEKANE